MNRPARSMASAAALLAGLLLALPAAAAEEGPFGTFLGLPRWLWMLANLVLFFGLIGYFLGPPLTRFLEARERRIREELEEARERRAQAAELQATLGDRIAELERQIASLGERAEADGRLAHERILEQAARERDRLLAQAESEIEHRLAQARQELKEFTATLAARLAREQLERELGPEERRRVFRRNLTRLEREAS